MNRWHASLARATASLLVASTLCLTGHATAAAVIIAPADIILESTSPYYQPAVAVVPAGTPIRWLNATGSPHSVRHDGCATDESCAFQSIAAPPDSSILIAPLPPGRYTYHCGLHPVMRGTVVVIDVTGQAEGSMETAGPNR
jgi:plastocyanin